MTEYLLYLYAESPLHAGAGGSVDGLDLPIQREASTGYPVIWGQSLKGALRQAAGDANRRGDPAWPDRRVEELFGEAEGATDDHGGRAGALSVGDAQLVALPVPTLRRTFAWVTTSLALSRLARKYKALGRLTHQVPTVNQESGRASGTVWLESNSGEVVGPCVMQLGEEPYEHLARWAERLKTDAISSGPEFQPFADKLTTDLLLIGDDIAPTLLRECTEQTVRVQLNENKTVKDGPFYSEYLPTETILAASLTLRSGDDPGHRDALYALLDEQVVQVGGDETLGKGLTRCRLIPEEAS